MKSVDRKMVVLGMTMALMAGLIAVTQFGGSATSRQNVKGQPLGENSGAAEQRSAVDDSRSALGKSKKADEPTLKAKPLTGVADHEASGLANRPSLDLKQGSKNPFARFGELTADEQAWFKRNGYPDDAELELLMSMDINSLRLLVGKGSLSAQTELAFRLSRDPGNLAEAGSMFRDAAVKGSKEAMGRNADSLESTSICSNAVTGNAYRLVAVMLGDLNALPKYVMCSHGLTPQEQGLTLAFASHVFADLNQQSSRLTGHPLQIDPDPRMVTLINESGQTTIKPEEGGE